MKREKVDQIGYKENRSPYNSGLIFDNRIPCEWLSTKEAANYLRISENALRISVYRGQVTVHKFGKRNRFKVEELRALLTIQGA
jgi:excisionase family DNA binding protein